MSNTRRAREALIARILAGDGSAPHAQRRAAFENAELGEPLSTLIDKVAMHAPAISDADITAVRAAGLTEDQTFEVVVCAAVGQAARQYDSAFAALDSAIERSGDAPRKPR